MQHIHFHDQNHSGCSVPCRIVLPQICFVLNPEQNCTIQQNHAVFIVSFKSLNTKFTSGLSQNITLYYQETNREISNFKPPLIVPRRAPRSAHVSWSVTQKLRSKVNAIKRDSGVKKSFINVSSGQQGQMHLHNPKDKWIRSPRHM